VARRGLVGRGGVLDTRLFVPGGDSPGLLRILAHSGGSSPQARTQIRCAAFVVAIDASAPSAASSPAHIRRLTMSLSVIAAAVYAEVTSERASRPSQMVTTTKSFARS